MKKVLHRAKHTLQKGLNSPLARTIGIYTFLNFFLRGISFLITPLFTHYISPDEFGTLNIYLNSINVITPFIFLGIINTMAVDYFRISKIKLSQQISTSIIFSILLTFFFIILILIFNNSLVMYFKLKTWYLVIVPILCFFNLLIDLYFTYLRNEEKVKIVSLSTILRIIIELTLSIFFVILLLIGWKGRIFSLILSTTIIAVVAFIYLYRKKIFIFYFDINFLRKEIPFWISILVGFIFIISFNTFDKYIIKYYCTEYELGDYSLASQFGFIILTFSSAVNSAYHPNLFKDLSESRPLSIIYKKILMLIGVNFIISIISIILVYLLMKYFINYRYANAWKYYYIIAMVYFMWSCIMILYGFIGYFKLKKVLFYLGFFSLIFFIPIQIIGAYLYKINGILYSQFLYLTLCFVSLTIYLNKKIKKNYQT